HGAIIFDIDGGAGLFGDRADGDATLADDVADLVRVNLDRRDARRELRHLGARLLDDLVHRFKNVQTAGQRLIERDLHDLAGNAGDLDVHLQRGDALGRTGDLEVHVAEVIFVAEDIGQHGPAIAFFDQTHRHTGNLTLGRHAGIHHREARSAGAGHRARA